MMTREADANQTTVQLLAFAGLNTEQPSHRSNKIDDRIIERSESFHEKKSTSDHRFAAAWRMMAKKLSPFGPG